MPQRRFASSPPVVIHTEPSTAGVKMNRRVISHRKLALPLLKRRDGPRHDDDICVFSRCFPGVPPVNLNPRTVYNHMDADIMCSDCDPDPPNILERDKVTFFVLHNYVIGISKHDAVWCWHSWGGFTEVSVRRADSRSDLYQHNHLSEFKFLDRDRRCFSCRSVTKSR